MKILTNEAMRNVDARTQAEFGISEQELMDEAGRAVARVALERFSPASVAVVCGKGNNAGDGYVAARYLRGGGTEIHIVAVGDPAQLTGAAAEACAQARDAGIPIYDAGELDAILERCGLVIDALCGTGIRGPLRDAIARAAVAINRAPSPVLSVDVPSGVRKLAPNEELGVVVDADVTVAIGAPKLCSILLPGSLHVGELVVERINFPPELLDCDSWQYNLAPTPELTSWLPPRPLTANKGTFGKVGIVAGSAPYAGAAILAARAALRAGAGLVYLFVNNYLNPIVKVALPEAVSVILPSSDPHRLDESSQWALLDAASPLDVLAVGMGLGTAVAQAELVRALVTNTTIPMVLDADALTCLAPALPPLRENIVITPHPGEMARLLHCTVAEVQRDRLATALRVASQTGATVLLKGADTLIARNDGQIWINPGGCAALAKGGTGDVLSGLIASLIGQGLEPWKAAVLGARLHLEAGRSCAERIGTRGVLASELADELPRVMAAWEGNPETPSFEIH
jgi:hydroxyethylthiazole kinase-like uncharacterized protein yjeF